MTRTGSSSWTRTVNFGGIGVVLLLIGSWQAAVDLDVVDFDYLPTPVEIAREAVSLTTSGDLFSAIAHTLRTTVVATSLATLVGASIGLAVGLVPWFRNYTMSSIDFLRTIPVTALVPAALLLWGPSDTAEIAVAAFAATWPILINTAGGVRAIPTRLRDVADVLHMSRMHWMRKFVIPAVVQSILLGVRLGIVVALVLAIVAEMLINPKGLGWAIIESQNALQAERLWAYTVATGVLAYVLNVLLVWGVRRALPGSVGQVEAGTA